MSNQTHRQQKVLEVFKLSERNKSPNGWILGGKCPFCNNNDKFGIKLNQDRAKYKNHVSFNCFHGSCQEHGTEWKLLKAVGLLHLIQDGEFIGDKEKLEQLNFFTEEIAPDLKVPKRHKPFGFRRVDKNDYLDSRGFEPWQYQTYCIGTTRLYDPLKNYVIFLVEEDGENKGSVARLIWSKEKIRQYEESTGRRALRYKNEGGVDFGKIVFGLDEITQSTEHVIIVEGITDKANVDRLLALNTQEVTKCCATFGKKISEEQILKLWGKGVKRITVLYDPDAINASKRHSYNLQLWFSDVKVGYLHSKDPGDLNESELKDVLNNLQSPGQFFIDKVQKLELK